MLAVLRGLEGEGSAFRSSWEALIWSKYQLASKGPISPPGGRAVGLV